MKKITVRKKCKKNQQISLNTCWTLSKDYKKDILAILADGVELSL